MLRVDGVPVGREIGPPMPVPGAAASAVESARSSSSWRPTRRCCRIQCQRLARRATTGLAWAGGIGANGSGDIFLAFSTGNRGLPRADYARQSYEPVALTMVTNDSMTELFEAAAEATEEAILNALLAARTMTGRGVTAHGLTGELVVAAIAELRE